MNHCRRFEISRARRLGLGLVAALAIAPSVSQAEVKLPAIFGSHMVLQRNQADKVWGWAEKGEKITVSIADQSKTTQARDDGSWSVKLDPMAAGGPHKLTVQGKDTVVFDDVLVGEVWVCSGQSNMQLDVAAGYDADLEALTAKHAKIRLISVPQVGTQEVQKNFKGSWAVCSPENVKNFSAVGYFFGRQLHETLGVPIGLIDDSWGGSAAEAWVRRDILEKDPKYQGLMSRWEGMEKAYEVEKASGKSVEPAPKKKAEATKKGTPKARQSLQAQMTGNARPGNIYNGVLKPTIGYGIKGVIWYQGESNASRAYQYRDLFPLMISSWRDEWGIGDFSFYWVQLADYLAEKAEPGESSWAELREAQSLTKKLPKTGQAVIIDLGEGRDIHPRDKQGVAKRLARLALAKDYGIAVASESPTYKSMEKKDGKVVLIFDNVGAGLYSFDTANPRGFAIAGADKKFHWADVKLVGKNQVEVSCDAVKDPVAVRYAWADNPVCNLYSREGLPVDPFRTDDWKGVTADAK